MPGKRVPGSKDIIIVWKTTKAKIRLARKLSSTVDTLFTTHLEFLDVIEKHMDKYVRTIIITEINTIEQVKFYISLTELENDYGVFKCPNLVMIAAVPGALLASAVHSVPHPRSVTILRFRPKPPKKKKKKNDEPDPNEPPSTKLPKPTKNIATNSRYKLEKD